MEHQLRRVLLAVATGLLLGGCSDDAGGGPAAARPEAGTPGFDSGGDAGKGCQPGFAIKKSVCPWNVSTAAPCPPGELCEDYRRCMPVGCNKGADCASRPERHYLFHDRKTSLQQQVLSGSISKMDAHGFAVISTIEKVYITTSLPEDIKLPIKDGDQVTAKFCRHGPPIAAYFVVLRDPGGKLLLAGGAGVGAAGTDCLDPEVKISRVPLDCAPFPPTEFDEYQPHANYALRFAADNTITLPQRGRGTLRVKGRSFRVANFRAYHPIEWITTDIYGPLESLLLVRQ